MSKPCTPVEERLWGMVNKTDSCWLWTRSVRRDGYGYIRENGRKGKDWGVHRLSYVIANGPIPDGLLVLHTCDVRRCVNPAHLFVGTYQDNMDDCVRKGRSASGDRNGSRLYPERMPKGSDHLLARLTEESVKEARQRYANGESIHKMNEGYGVSVPTLWKAVVRQTWKHVP